MSESAQKEWGRLWVDMIKIHIYMHEITKEELNVILEGGKWWAVSEYFITDI